MISGVQLFNKIVVQVLVKFALSNKYLLAVF